MTQYSIPVLRIHPTSTPVTRIQYKITATAAEMRATSPHFPFVSDLSTVMWL